MPPPGLPLADRLDLQRISAAFRGLGWITFWAQLAMAVVCLGVLTFNSLGAELIRNRERAIGLGPGLSLTTLSLLLLAWSVWQDWGLIGLGRSLGGGGARPSRGETTARLKRHILASLGGVTLAVVGYQALAGSLTFQASLQQPGFAGSAGLGNNAITSLEMFSVLANTQVLTGHLIGLWVTLWLLQRIQKP